MLRNEANDGLGEMDVEIVANDIPPCVGGGAAQQGVEKTSKVLLGPGVADHPGDFAGRDIETGDQGACRGGDTRIRTARPCPFIGNPGAMRSSA